MNRLIIGAALGALGVAAIASAATFSVINESDAGPGSLRQAILDANATPGADLIAFNIPGPGVHTISPLSALPALTDDAGVTIDGYSQPGSSHNTLAVGDNAVLLIELSGTAAETFAGGITVRSSFNRIRGLVINSFGAEGAGGGILIQQGSNNTVSGCLLGTSAVGSVAKPNVVGVAVAAAGTLVPPIRTTIGGVSPPERNVISGNDTGVVVSLGSSDTLVIGNYVGTDVNGTAIVANGTGVGVTLSQGTTIGGPAGGLGNLISGNGVGIGIIGAQVIIQGNRIGTNATGAFALPNASGILTVGGTTDTVVGGDTSGAGNLISGNSLYGVRMLRPQGNRLLGNLIGTDISGTSPLGNGTQGVLIQNLSAPDLIGGTIDGNVIAFNGSAGVAVGSDLNDVTSSDRITGNSIHDNGGLGIDLGSNGVTPNDAADTDTGPNGLQNFPVLTSAVSNGGVLTVVGTLDGAPGTTFSVELFSNSACDPSGYGEGQSFLGALSATTGAAGHASFQASVSTPFGAAFVTATATDSAGDTSEFSACSQLAVVPSVPVPVSPIGLATLAVFWPAWERFTPRTPSERGQR